MTPNISIRANFWFGTLGGRRRSLRVQRVLELALGHLGAVGDVALAGPRGKLVLGRAAVAGPGACGLGAALGAPGRVLAAHRRGAFAFSARADMRLALGFLLIGFALRLLALAARQA